MASEQGCPIEMHRIGIEKCDEMYDPDCKGDTFMPFHRAQYDKNTGQSPNSPREQVTRFIPDSVVFIRKQNPEPDIWSPRWRKMRSALYKTTPWLGKGFFPQIENGNGKITKKWSSRPKMWDWRDTSIFFRSRFFLPLDYAFFRDWLRWFQRTTLSR